MSDTVVIQSVVDLQNRETHTNILSSANPVKLDTRPWSARRNSTGQQQTLSPPSSPDSDVEGLDYYYSSPGEEYEDEEQKSRGSRGTETSPIILNEDDPFIKDFGIQQQQQQNDGETIDKVKQDPHVLVGKSSSSSTTTTKQQQNKMTFDLAAFARHLHEHRLSVMQASRQSQIVLTEQDELELENLLKKHPLPSTRTTTEATIRESMFLKKLNECGPVPTQKDESNVNNKTNERPPVRPTESLSDPTNALASPRRAPQPPKRFTPPARPRQLPIARQSHDTAARPIVAVHHHRREVEEQPERPRDQKSVKSLGLFGSLRQRTRPQSPRSIKGLMRTLSSSSVLPSRNHQQRSARSASMSPAAMAVLNHDKQRMAPATDEQKTIKRTLSQLLTKRRVVTKTINMDHDKSVERNNIVRRTIILVEPDPSKGSTTAECDNENENRNDVKGVEVRELSDGTVVWGMVENKTKDHHQASTPPPPIPRRSPQRLQEKRQLQHQNTDIYYAPEMALPSLVQIMSTINQEPPSHMSVEEQLDEFMRSLGYHGN